MEAAGVNDRAQLAVAEAELRDRINERWMRRGVTMWDPERTYVDAEVAPGGRRRPCCPGVILRGDCSVGAGAEIGPNSVLTDTTVGERRGGRRERLHQGRRSVPGRGSGPSASWSPGPRCRRATAIVPPHRRDAGRPRRLSGPATRARSRGAVALARVELIPRRRLELVSGRSHPSAGPGHRRPPGRRARRGQPARVRQRRDPLQVRHLHPRLRRLHHPDPLPAR